MDEADKRAEDGPGMLGVVEGVRAQRWPHTVDAQVWADQFNATLVELGQPTPPFDRGFLIGWFANAIMAGHDTASVSLAAVMREKDAEIERLRLQLSCAGNVTK